jgi:hypothetical protein
MVPLRAIMQLSSHTIHLFPSSVLSDSTRDSRGPASPRTPSVHPTRPAQLPLSDAARPTILRRAPPHHLRLFLPRLQLAHRLRGTRPRSGPRSQIGGCQWWRWGRRNKHRRCAAQYHAAFGRLHAAGKVVSHLLEAEARAYAPLLPVWALCA